MASGSATGLRRDALFRLSLVSGISPGLWNPASDPSCQAVDVGTQGTVKTDKITEYHTGRLLFCIEPEAGFLIEARGMLALGT